jgi:hypothetical protein
MGITESVVKFQMTIYYCIDRCGVVSLYFEITNLIPRSCTNMNCNNVNVPLDLLNLFQSA